MRKGTLLLASSGKEFIKPNGILSSSSEVKKARKEAMGRLGLDFLYGLGANDDMDFDKELAAGSEPDAQVPGENEAAMNVDPPPVSADLSLDVNTKLKKRSPSPRSKSTTPVAPSPSVPCVPQPDEDMSGLSARERNRLKRKRKQGNSAFVQAPPPTSSTKFQPTAAGSANKLVAHVWYFLKRFHLVAGLASLLQMINPLRRRESKARQPLRRSLLIRRRGVLSPRRRPSSLEPWKLNQGTGYGMA